MLKGDAIRKISDYFFSAEKEKIEIGLGIFRYK